ncbi:MAG: hypothetical protein ACFFAE_02490 [Candidatus Hodarchaeota archaeon]
MANGSSIIIPFFFLFFIFIIILIYFNSVKEKEFAESAKLMIEKHFPQLQTTIISEGGFISNPEISASPIDKNYPIHDLLLKYKVYGSGKHRKQDLILSAFISAEKSLDSEFTVIVKREGFFRRVFGGENVQLGHRTLDDRLFIHGSNPGLVQSYLCDKNFKIASKIASIYDLKECKLEHYGDSINLVIRSDHTNIRYVSALLDLISALANVDSLYPKPQERGGFRTTTWKAIESIPYRKQRFKDPSKDISYENQQTSFHESLDKIEKTEIFTKDTNLFESIKEKLVDKSYLASNHKILDTSAELSFNIGYFQSLNFKWDDTTISVSAVKESALMPFRILIKTLSRKEEGLSFYDPFDKIEIMAEPKELLNSLKERTEIGRTFNRLIGDFPTTMELFSNKNTISFSVKAPCLPENIDPLYDLTQSIGWFLEFSFL